MIRIETNEQRAMKAMAQKIKRIRIYYTIGFRRVEWRKTLSRRNNQKAVNGVLRKISRKEDRHTITENSYMSKTKYHRITGACYSGISLWCAMQGIDENAKIKVSDLLPILEKTKAYGYQNLLNTLNQ